VTCVGSKNYEGPSIRNTLDALIERGKKNYVEGLFREWKRTLLQHMHSSPTLPEARSIYRGALWNASLEAFKRIQEPCNLWIMSCGFGFINAQEKISGYHATFKTGVEDSLFNSNYFNSMKKENVKKQWWNLLSDQGIIETTYPKSIHELVGSSNSKDVVLISAGSDYYEAIIDDLHKIDASQRLPKLAFVGIQKMNGNYNPEMPKKLELFIQSYSSGVDLRKFLGCSAIQIHAKSATYLIEQYNRTGKLEYMFP